MPAILTPPEIERRPRGTEENDGGNGRRPPNNRDLKRTGGGGDNENWNGRTPGRRGPRERLATYRLGLFFALGAVFMFFIGIVSVFFVSQNTGHFDAYNHYINAWLPTTVPPLLWLNTLALILSSITMEVARRRMFHQIEAMEEWFGLGRPTSRRALPWLVATLLLGMLFLVGQMLAWHQLGLQRVFFRSNPGSHSFFIITYAHAAHLTAGVAGLLAAVAGLFRLRSMENRQILVDCVGWYWHSMGALWLALFGLLAFCQ
ncbi:MAG: heme-copper oxidase subunit III [Acidobacteriota bacterium]|nr:heme-copper oxidase subunit III [Acidobacteriota bacterium]